MKERNISIDILKFFAAVLITNSHMEKLYHPYELLGRCKQLNCSFFYHRKVEIDKCNQ